jgi:hypothetical protein
VILGLNHCDAYGGAPHDTVIADLSVAAQMVRAATLFLRLYR